MSRRGVIARGVNKSRSYPGFLLRGVVWYVKVLRRIKVCDGLE
jgi:hypothetical protein